MRERERERALYKAVQRISRTEFQRTVSAGGNELGLAQPRWSKGIQEGGERGGRGLRQLDR
jgi:hypothetical protein